VSSTHPAAATDNFATPSIVGAGILAAFYFVTSLYIASQRLFWFDEIFTVRIGGLADLAVIWNALAHGADGIPLGYYVVAMASEKLLGPSQVAVRLPSALAVALGMLITFDCARRLTDGLHGLIALAALACSYLPFYGYEARSYAIYFMLAALSFWIWICTPDDKWWSAIAFGATLFTAVTIHYYAVLLLAPYAIWDLRCWKLRKVPSLKLIAGILGVLLSVLLMWKQLSSFSREFSNPYSATPLAPTFHGLRTVFEELFPDGLFLLVFITVWIVVSLTKSGKTTVEPIQAGESVAWLFLCIPLAGFALAEWKTHAFLSRYFISTLPGIAVAFSSLLWRHFHNCYRVPLGVLLLLTSWGLALQVTASMHPERIVPHGHPTGQQMKVRHYLALEAGLRGEGKRFLVFSNSVLHLEVAYYCQHRDECILLLPESGQESVLNAMEFKLAQYYPLQFWSVDDLMMHASQAALVEPTPAVLHALKQAGLTFTVRFPPPMEVVYVQ
jgi:hypothetical protein